MLKKSFMLKRMRYVQLLCVLFFAFATQAQTKNTIHQLEQLRYQAMIDVDTATLSSFLHNDLEYYHSNGMMDTKQSLLDGIATKKLVHKNITVTKEHIRVYKSTAIVTGLADYDIIWNNQPLLLHFVFTNVYLKKHKKWVLINRQTVKV